MGSDTEEQISNWDNLKETFIKEFKAKWASPVKYNVKMEDFHISSVLGKGAFGIVYLVEKDEEFLAMKCLSKSEIVHTKQVDHAMNEKKILASINFEFILRLSYAFQTNSYLFLVTEFAIGGEMFNLLKKLRKMPEPMVLFYSAQVLMALEYLHNLNIVYRDLKPENLLITGDGYTKLADLGFAKQLQRDKRAWTLCGTPDYMAPEVILNKGHHLPVDWWSFGVLLYELTCGYPPFMANDQMKTFEKITSGKFKFTSDFQIELKALIRGLLQTDLSKRFGNLRHGVEDIKEHAYYDETNFTNIYTKSIDAPFKPKVKTKGDISNFDKIRDQKLVNQSVDQYSKYFKDF
ncbi:hypothetical protein Ciccas_000692 [Cichlidogyrus casuarinus]|uniref:Uncharacterized protein n=1 Tax=Cichlidogyrus casuarinus TaxID=1844966 RepID=A0ABD2QNA4_9PLAT